MKNKSDFIWYRNKYGNVVCGAVWTAEGMYAVATGIAYKTRKEAEASPAERRVMF